MVAINSTWNHIRRNPYQSMAAVLTMFLTMFLAGIFFLVSLGSFITLRYFEGKPQITVFFTNEATQQDADTLSKTLEGTGKVSSVTYISKDEALAIYREQNKSDPLLLEMVSAEILPASLEISANNPEFLSELEPVIKQAPNVEEVVYQKDVVDTLIRWTNAIRMVGSVIVGLFAVNAILIVMTVIGMKIALKKDEIEILTLIGASPWYIRKPFVMEGGAYGSFGAFLSWGLSGVLLLWLRPAVLAYIGMIPVMKDLLGNPAGTPFIIFIFGYLAVLCLVGFILGAFGSLVAITRYMRG